MYILKKTIFISMEIIPAIDLLDGNCVRLDQGKYDKVTEFNKNPLSQALEWQSKGASKLHLVDLDAAKTGSPINDKAIKQISEALDIPIQIGGGIRTLKRAEELFNYGIDKVILGTVAIEKPELVKELANNYPGKVIVGIDAKDGKVATRGWTTHSNTTADQLARNFSNLSLSAFIATDISTDGTLQGPNLDFLRDVACSSQIPIIASGGIGSIEDLLSLISLESYGVIGVIVGRAIYDGSVDLEQAIKATSKPRSQDPPLDSSIHIA